VSLSWSEESPSELEHDDDVDEAEESLSSSERRHGSTWITADI
jgi:hypothetical protein